MAKTINASFRTWRNPYRVKWLTKRATLEKHKPSLYAISFFDEDTEEDIEILPVKQDLEWVVTKVSGAKNQYDVSADGTITLSLDPKVLAKLEQAKFMVDHAVEFRCNDILAESGEDFEFVENSAIELDVHRS